MMVKYPKFCVTIILALLTSLMLCNSAIIKRQDMDEPGDPLSPEEETYMMDNMDAILNALDEIQEMAYDNPGNQAQMTVNNNDQGFSGVNVMASYNPAPGQMVDADSFRDELDNAQQVVQNMGVESDMRTIYNGGTLVATIVFALAFISVSSKRNNIINNIVNKPNDATCWSLLFTDGDANDIGDRSACGNFNCFNLALKGEASLVAEENSPSNCALDIFSDTNCANLLGTVSDGATLNLNGDLSQNNYNVIARDC